MKLKVKLSGNLIELLRNLPESGMGYQIVNIYLDTGNIIKSVKVLNSSIALLDENVDLTSIKAIEVVKNRKIVGRVNNK